MIINSFVHIGNVNFIDYFVLFAREFIGFSANLFLEQHNRKCSIYCIEEKSDSENTEHFYGIFSRKTREIFYGLLNKLSKNSDFATFYIVDIRSDNKIKHRRSIIKLTITGIFKTINITSR